MDLFDAAQGGRLNPAAFDDAVRRGTRDLAEVLSAVARTGADKAGIVHVLMALGRIPGGVTRAELDSRKLTPDKWEVGLASCAPRPARAAEIRQLTSATLDPVAHGVLHAARERAEKEGGGPISEAVLLLAALDALTDPPGQTPWPAAAAVRELFADAGFDLAKWKRDIEDVIHPPGEITVFDERGAVVRTAFTAGGVRVLGLMQAEAQALGYDKIDPRHLLLALAGWDGGATHAGLHHQGRSPRKVHEAVMLNLRGRARKTRTAVPLDHDHFQPTLTHTLELAGKLAGQARAGRVAEAHLLRAFLAVESTARGLLADQEVNPDDLRRSAEAFDVSAEGGGGGPGVAADVATVEQQLKARLAGQDAAIEQILPYVEFMQFGMTTPGHPVGVFLFCGRSGTGKTEMAKELARSVYGDEESLVFLEMGQFNAPESMNIFVGAPPGYIGYGEGKLTNGLRDKPRSVVLFDEVDKAHGKVLDALLRFLDEGRIDDPAGPVRDGTQCIVILTSNVAADSLDEIWGRWGGKPDAKTGIRRELREKILAIRPPEPTLRVEFLNRVDEVILFNSFKPEHYTEIARRTLVGLRETLAASNQVEVIDAATGRPLGEPGPDGTAPPTGAAHYAIGAACAELNEGARAVSRVARSAVLLPVCRFVMGANRARPVRVKVKVTRPGGAGAEPVGVVELA